MFPPKEGGPQRHHMLQVGNPPPRRAGCKDGALKPPPASWEPESCGRWARPVQGPLRSSRASPQGGGAEGAAAGVRSGRPAWESAERGCRVTWRLLALAGRGDSGRGGGCRALSVAVPLSRYLRRCLGKADADKPSWTVQCCGHFSGPFLQVLLHTMAALLKSLLAASEKAANIAQLCRQEEALFSLLIEEKRGADKNKKFLQDFKTLADVLIQEVIKHDVGKEFPELQGYIRGEESNKFENGLGETVVVQVCPTQSETAALLQRVLDRNQMAAELLAAAIHQEMVLSDPALDNVTVTISTENMAVWIDPIDSTNQYIRGRGDVVPVDGIYPSGLRSALVLIGVYNRHSGEPVLGIINEPFFQEQLSEHRWQSRYHWGISYGDTNLSSLSRPIPQAPPRVVLSSSEKVALQKALVPLYGEQLCFASGAGYKMLCVALGFADAYVLSEGSTFKWDTCGPHAILRALGGGIADFAGAVNAWRAGQHDHLPELTYNKPEEGAVGADRWANHGGVIAYMYQEHLETVVKTLAAASDVV